MNVDVNAARYLLTETVGLGTARWHHSHTAADAALDLAPALPAAERHLLVAAAWLHDIGYHHPFPPTGFHPIDGGLLLLDHGWPPRLAALVAHHSEARFTAAAQGLLPMLEGFPREEGPVADGLVYADMTAAPSGGRVMLPARLAEVRRRHAQDPPAVRAARTSREPFLLLAVARCEVRVTQQRGRLTRALPVPADYVPSESDIRRLADQHRDRSRLDLLAALRAAASLTHTGAARGTRDLADDAGRLLDATQEDWTVCRSSAERGRAVTVTAWVDCG